MSDRLEARAKTPSGDGSRSDLGQAAHEDSRPRPPQISLLARGSEVTRPDEVWCTDITDVPMPGGHAYRCAVMDWDSRKVLGWAVSNSMETGFCLEALENALTATGRIPEIFNTDQGCQFTSAEWSGRLLDLGIKISRDGRGRWMDKVFIERLWRTIKDEEIYLFEHSTVTALEVGGGGEMVRSRQRLAAPCDA